MNAANIKDWTAKDPLMSKVKQYIMAGWPETQLGEEFKPYRSRWKELSTLDGWILWGSRVVIPPQGRKAALVELHETHTGCSKMKALARSYIWWPKMDQEIEALVQKCSICQESRSSPPSAPLHPWQWPGLPWSRLHLDFAGPYMGHMFLVIVDVHSKWLDAHIMSSITSAKTIVTLRSVFATHGLPRVIVTDNGSSFTSEEFKTFVCKNGIKHVTSAPYHPSTNGEVERAVQTLKRDLKRTPGNSVQERLTRFLFDYRITPHTTGVPPCVMLMNRRLRSRLDQFYPDVSGKVESRQAKQKELRDQRSLRQFTENDQVYVQDFTTRKSKWIPGTVVQVTGPLSYRIKLQDGTIVRRHVDHVRKRENSIVDQGSDTKVFGPELGMDETTQPPIVPTSQEDSQQGSQESETPTVSQGADLSSTQSRNPPDRFLVCEL